jgi:hypothetical protein
MTYDFDVAGFDKRHVRHADRPAETGFLEETRFLPRL